jgi:hypothetical protein
VFCYFATAQAIGAYLRTLEKAMTQITVWLAQRWPVRQGIPTGLDDAMAAQTCWQHINQTAPRQINQISLYSVGILS